MFYSHNITSNINVLTELKICNLTMDKKNIFKKFSTFLFCVNVIAY